MKLKFLFLVLSLTPSLQLISMEDDMWEDDESENWQDDESEDMDGVQGSIIPIVRGPTCLYAVPENDSPALQGFVYRPTMPIHDVVMRGNYQHLVERLKTATPEEVNQSDDRNGNTPLHYAARQLSYRKVDLLLKNKAKANATNKEGKSAADVIPALQVIAAEGIANIMKPQYVIKAMLEQANIHPYEIKNDLDALKLCADQIGICIGEYFYQMEVVRQLNSRMNRDI